MKRLYLETVDSTNKWAKEHISEIDDRTLVYTYNQTAGKGRLNRVWNNTGVDNIYASIVLKPSDTMRDVYSNLTQYLCVILAETFEEYGVIPKIKWPNDIKINNKKISGILAEAVYNAGKLDGLVLGFGVNLNTTKENLDSINQPATSLNIETGTYIDKENFLKKVTDKFCLLYDKFIDEGFPSIKDEYVKRALFINKEVSVDVLNIIISGRATNITDSGALVIVDKNNTEHTLLIGDIL